MEFLVQPNGVIVLGECTKQVNYLIKKCPPLTGNFAGVMEVTNQGFQLPSLREMLGGPPFMQCNNVVSFLSGQACLKPIGVKFNPENS